MKRFYCTICKRARRVRKYPTNVSNVSAENVTDRTGQCAWHTDPLGFGKTIAKFGTMKGGR